MQIRGQTFRGGVNLSKMIDKNKLTDVIEDAIKDTDIFLVDVKVSPDNNITVEIDSMKGLDIATCADLTRKIEAEFDREVEDYELEVGSAGLTSPFKVKQQYVKNIGNDVDVVTRDGRKLSGRLVEVGDSDFTIEVPTKVKVEGQKRPTVQIIPQTIAMDNAKSVVYAIKFK